MSEPNADRSRNDARRIAVSGCVVLTLVLAACGGNTRRASTPQGRTTTTAAEIGPSVERLVVAEPGSIAMIARGGCLATVRTVEGGAGSTDELRVRCPKPERIKTWFEGADRVAATLALEPLTREEDEEIEVSLPVAKLLTTSGKAFRVANAADVEKLAREVRALSAELASAEQVTPGPATGKGWQMLHVMGPAHVLVAGVPATGTLEARVSSTGQYLCEFVTNVDDGPIRATKSGWLSSATAGRAIDDALEAFRDPGPNEKSTTTYAAGTKGGSEVRTARSSTGEVFERFAEIQEALGDACLPELEAPSVSPADL